MKILKTQVKFFGRTIPALAITLVMLIGGGSAALLTYYGQITGQATLQQAVTLDGQADNSIITETTFNGVAGDSDISSVHYITNNANVPVMVNIENTCCDSSNQCGYSTGEGCEGVNTATQVQLTTGAQYIRNPSLVKDGNTWYLFYAQDTNSAQNGKGCDESGLNCDSDTYEIYVIKSIDNGMTWLSPVKVSTPIIGFNQRDVSGVWDGSTLYAFVSSGSGSKPIYYYTSTDGGATWSSYTQVSTSNPVNVGHFDAVYFDSKLWIFYGESDGLAIRNSDNWDIEYKATMSNIAHSKVLKVMVDGSNVTVVWEKSGDGIWYTTSDNPIDANSWTIPKEIAKSHLTGYGDYDPVIYKDSNGKYWLFWAPYDSTVGNPGPQWIAYKVADTKDNLVYVTPYKFTVPDSSKQWWDFWPEASEDSNGNVIIMYTSESSSSGTRTNGNIWMATFGDRTMSLPSGNQLGMYIFNGFDISLNPDTYTITTKITPY